MNNLELNVGNFLLEAHSFIESIDRLKGTTYYQGDIKILMNQLTTKIYNKYKRQMSNMFNEENAETAYNLVDSLEKFSDLAVNEKQMVVQMCEYYKNDRQYWQDNLILKYNQLNKWKQQN